jgi:drug/metabolite transporter (DMT)-like permease
VNQEVAGKEGWSVEAHRRWVSTRMPNWMMQLVGLTALWAAMETAAASISRHYHPMQTVGMRYGFHLLFIASWCLLLRKRGVLRTAHPVLQLARGACMFVTPAALVMGAAAVSASSVWALFWTAPIIAVVLARMFLGERCETATWIALSVSLGAALLVLEPNTTRVRLELAWPLLAAISFAAYVSMSRALKDEALASSLAYTGIGAFCAALPWMLSEWRPIMTADFAIFAGIAGVGMLFLAWLDQALSAVPVQNTAPFLFMVVFWEMVIDFLWRQERPSMAAAAGWVIWLVAIWISIHYGRASERVTSPSDHAGSREGDAENA